MPYAYAYVYTGHVVSVGLGALEQDELSTYLKKFTDVWVAYALLLIAYVEVLSLFLSLSLSLSFSLSLPLFLSQLKATNREGAREREREKDET